MNRDKRARLVVLIVFGLVAAAQLAVPLALIGREEANLRGGELWRFRIVPFDPYDAFRGRYLQFQMLDIDLLALPAVEYAPFEEGDELCGLLALDDRGFGFLRAVLPWEERSEGEACLKLQYLGDGMVQPPFDRYYINQARAKAIDQAFSSSWDTPCWIEVRLSDGRGTIQNFWINDEPVD